MNPFSPDRPLLDPNFFSGREELIQRAIGYISNFRTLFITGSRGIGKSSFAAQIREALNRNPDSVTRFKLNLPELSPYMISYRCSGSEDLPALLRQLEMLLFEVFEPSLDNRSVRTETRTIDLKIFKSESQTRYEAPQIDSLTLRLTNLIQYLQISYPSLAQHGLVFFIDEIDLAVPKNNLGAFLKVLIDNLGDLGIANISFVLVGIDTAYKDLLRQHPSVVRYLTEILLPPMSEKELGDIIRRALTGTNVTFSPAVVEMMYRVAMGYPYPIHTFGYELFEDAKIKGGFIGIVAFEQAISRIVKVHEQVFVEMLARIPDRTSELILFQMAREKTNFLPIESIANESGKSTDTCMEACQNMVSLGYLERRGFGLYRIQNPAFHVYLKLLALENDLLVVKSKVKLEDEYVAGARQLLSREVSEEAFERKRAHHEKIEEMMWQFLRDQQLSRNSNPLHHYHDDTAGQSPPLQ